MAETSEKEKGIADRGLGGTIKYVPPRSRGPQGVIVHGQKVWELQEDVQIEGKAPRPQKEAPTKTAPDSQRNANRQATPVTAKPEPPVKPPPVDSKTKAAAPSETPVAPQRHEPAPAPGPSTAPPSSVSPKQRGVPYEWERPKAPVTPKNRGTAVPPIGQQRQTTNPGSDDSLADIQAYRRLWVSDSDPIYDIRAAAPEWPGPSSDPKYLDNLVESVSISAAGAGYVLHWTVNGRRVSAILPDSWLVREHNLRTVTNFGTVYPTRQGAIAALTPLILAAGGRGEKPSLYVGVWSNDEAPFLFPTKFSDVTAPRIMAAIEAKDEQMKVAAREAEEEMKGLARGMVFSRLLSGAYAEAADPKTWEIAAPKTSVRFTKAPSRTNRTPILRTGPTSGTTAPPSGTSSSTPVPRVEGTSSTGDVAKAPQSTGPKPGAKLPSNGVPDKTTTLGSSSVQTNGEAPVAIPQGTAAAGASTTLSPPQLESKNVVLSGETANTGGIRKIWAYREPDGTLRFRITGDLKDPLPRPHPNTPDFNRLLPTGSEIGLDSYEIAHLWGPGFGDEAMDGLMYAPREVNQEFQNRLAESRLRELHKIAADMGATVQVTATAESYPVKTWGGNALLKEVSYDFQIRLPNGKTLQVGRVDISVPAPGEAGNVTVEVVAGSAGIWSLK